MTTEERLSRIEHITAGLDEQRRKDHEEDRQLWRDTQRQIDQLSTRTLQMGDELRHTMDRLAEELRAEARTARAAEQELRDRIASLTSAIGQLVAHAGIPPQPPA